MRGWCSDTMACASFKTQACLWLPLLSEGARFLPCPGLPAAGKPYLASGKAVPIAHTPCPRAAPLGDLGLPSPCFRCDLHARLIS